ncbi:MAG: type II secretion system F family protein [Planctomycetota bacterium]
MIYAIAGLVLVSALLVIGAIWLLWGSNRGTSSRIKERLQGVRQVDDYNLGEELAEQEERREEEKKRKRQAVRQTAFSDVPYLQKKFGGRPWAERLHSQLQQADISLSVMGFLGLSAGAALLGAIGGLVVERGFHPVLVPFLAIVFGVVPYIYVIMVVGQRLKKFNEQFPDALDLLSNSVKSGQSLNNAIQNVAEEMPDPVAEEFGVMADELTFGESPKNVLKNFQNRMNTEDVRVFCAALQIQRETGGNLSEVLDGLQETILERFRILRQVKTLTAQGRLSGWIVGGLPIALGGALYAFNPEYVGLLFTSTTGNYMLAAAGTMQVIGVLLIRKIVDIKV